MQKYICLVFIFTYILGCDISGENARWSVDFLKAVMHQTPHTWATHTLQCFPPFINDFYKQHGAPRDTHNLKVTTFKTVLFYFVGIPELLWVRGRATV